ncbi:MAG: hypothetical protein PVF27_08790 [Gemmatimonadales bacterium]
MYIEARPELARRLQRQRRVGRKAADRIVTAARAASPKRGTRMAKGKLVLILLAAGLLLSACAGKRVLAPPRFDLIDYRPTGLVTFTVENAEGSLHEVATRRFAAALFDAQPGIELLELGEADPLLDELGVERLGADAARAIGEAYEVPAVFVGHMEVSDVTPRASIGNLLNARVAAEVTVEMTVRLLSCASGATVWSRTIRGTDTVGELGISGGDVFFGADDPDEAYGRLVDFLIQEITVDFRPRWVRAR